MKNLLGTLSLTLVLGMTAVPVAGQEGGKAPAAATPTQAAPAQPPQPAARQSASTPRQRPTPGRTRAGPPAGHHRAVGVHTSQYRLGVDALRQ